MYNKAIETLRPVGGRKRDQVLRELRRQIVDGVLQPGSRLPTRSVLERQFDISTVTLQRVMDHLTRDGLLQARGRQGTFVTANPPHLHRYGLVFPVHPADTQRWVRFWAALNDEAMAMNHAGTCEVVPFYGLDGHADSEDLRRLLTQVGRGQLAGLIMAFEPESVLQELAQEEPRLPWVSLMPTGARPGVPVVGLNTRSFFDKTIEALAKRGRKRVAILSRAEMGPHAFDDLLAGLRDRGMTVLPYWMQSAHPAAAETVHNLMHLLMHADKKPDSLIITDDNFVEHASAGLIAAGVSVPRNLEIVAHCNFPWPTPSVVPTTRIGFDANEVLRTCIGLINQQRTGERVSAVIQLRAMTEDEWRVRFHESVEHLNGSNRRRA